MPDAPGPVQKHPPERGRRRADATVLYGCCCCCCCCCLHTVGGVIGAAAAGSAGPTRGDRLRADADGTDPDDLPSGQGLFWTSVLMVVAVVVVLALAFGGGSPVERLTACGFWLVILGPVVLLLGWVVMLVRISRSPRLRRFRGYRRDLGRIFLFGLVGTLAGAGVMLALFHYS